VSILLESIAFNHDPNSADKDAINLRRNATMFLPVPEWQSGISVDADDSIAAYAIEETKGRTITIRVKLRRTHPAIREIEVRAIPVKPAVLPPWVVQPWAFDPWTALAWGSPVSQYWSYYLSAYLWQLASLSFVPLPSHVAVLGSVKARSVGFEQNQETAEALFELQNPQLAMQGVGAHQVIWQWQHRIQPGGIWRNFALSRHKIYTILAVPSSPSPYPWQQLPYHPANTQLPWSNVMAYACEWAFGATTQDEAATRITRTLFDLGGRFFRYGCELGAITQYTDLINPYFFCSEFLEYLGGGLGRGGFINCTDCATVVSTFANILGCQLWQSRMYENFEVFLVNPIRAIGSDQIQTPCGWPGFNMHEVAWKGDCTADDEVFDACLEVDGGADPTRPPFTAQLPTNMRFGQPGDGLYRDRLAAPQNRAREICEPQPGERRRRFII
jgi:hypothetical protein